jgi:acylpyruvate hydrolase
LLPGLLLQSQVFSIDALLQAIGEQAVGSVRELLRQHGGSLPALSQRLLDAAAEHPEAVAGAVDSLRLGPPVTDPGKVLCIGLNYKDHVAETGRALPSHPDIFAKFDSSLIGPQDDIRCSQISDNMDFEGELALVIGRECRNVKAEDALDAIAGLMVLNDITARDLQYRGTQWLAGKALDGSTPCGPALVTLDETGDPQQLDIATRVNGVEMQRSNTRYMIFPLCDLVAYISTFLTLSPGDIITTGTPEGIGAKRKPPVWLQPGDSIEVEVQNVGLLRNVLR